MRRVFSVAVAAASCCGVLLLVACAGEHSKNQAPPPPLVAIHKVEARDWPYPAQYQGMTQGSKAVEARARVTAVIQKRLYAEGAYVKEGQQLFQLERDAYEAAYQEASAQFDLARREWNRIRPLYEKNAVSQRDRDAARAAYERARASKRAAEINLDYCQVVSPVSGYAGKEHLTAGNLVSNGSLLTTINQTEPLHVNFAIPAPDMMFRRRMTTEGRLAPPPGGVYTARIRLLDGAVYEKTGKVAFIDAQVDQATGTVRARAEFPNENGYVMPGQYVRLFMEGDVLKNAVLIPQKAVLVSQMGALVMVVGEGDKVEARPLKLDVAIGDMYLVSEGLKGGERIILEGLVKARPGMPVSIRREGPGTPPQGRPAGPGK